MTGSHVDTAYRLPQALHLNRPGTPVKIIERFQMVGGIKPGLLDALGVDMVSLGGRGTAFGFTLEGWKEWGTVGGTLALVPVGFNTKTASNGALLLYPQCDSSALFSACMLRRDSTSTSSCGKSLSTITTFGSETIWENSAQSPTRNLTIIAAGLKNSTRILIRR
ncbi:MAG: hypothetical protein ABSA41_12045 [Terriglobia bacterium]